MATVITQNARNQLTAIIEDFGSFFLGKGSTQARALSGSVFGDKSTWYAKLLSSRDKI